MSVKKAKGHLYREMRCVWGWSKKDAKALAEFEGERMKQPKLTDKLINQIVEMRKDKATYTEITKRTGATPTTIAKYLKEAGLAVSRPPRWKNYTDRKVEKTSDEVILIDDCKYKRGAHGYIFYELNGEWLRSSMNPSQFKAYE